MKPEGLLPRSHFTEVLREILQSYFSPTVALDIDFCLQGTAHPFHPISFL